jgi:hypothetical protein
VLFCWLGLRPESFAYFLEHMGGEERFVVGAFVGTFVEAYGRE